MQDERFKKIGFICLNPVGLESMTSWHLKSPRTPSMRLRNNNRKLLLNLFILLKAIIDTFQDN